MAFFALGLLGPAAAHAQSADYPATVWAAEYESVDQIEGGVIGSLRLVNQSGFPNGAIGQVRGAALPFGFRFFGSEPFLKFNVGAKGYVTFGDDTAGAHSTSQKSPQLLVQPGSPVNLIGAWWGDHFCDPEGGIRTKTLGVAPHREFVIEWSGCSMLQGLSGGSGSTFQAQLWLAEGSDVIRLKYGSVQLDPDFRWPVVSWGLKPPTGLGWLGPDAMGRDGVCIPSTGTAACGASHFPANTVIQYGLSEDADLAARVTPSLKRLVPGGVELEVLTELLNAGKVAVGGVGFDLYLAEAPSLAPGEPGTWPIHAHPAGERLEGGERRSFSQLISTPQPPSGIYRVCIFIDPDDTLGERDRTNNRSCSHQELRFGPDLTGTIEGPAEGAAGVERMIRFSIRNGGNLGAGPFDYTVAMNPRNASAGVQRQTLYEGRVTAGLAAGQSIVLDRMMRLPDVLRGATYTFELEIDVGEEVADADRSNNLIASGPMTNHRPHLQLTLPLARFDIGDGCFYGEKIEATFEVCNEGKAAAVGFRPGIIMGDEQVNAAFDVPAASNPSFCGVPGTWNYRACEPVGGRVASCVFEYCRVPCATDDQCSSGMRCSYDPLLSEHLHTEGAKSCMNFLDVATAPREQRCRTYTMSGTIPLEDQDETPYEIGRQYFHVIDDVLHSTSQEFPTVYTLPSLECRPALMDLAAIELEPTGPLVVGKGLPIARLIWNEGFINLQPGDFTRPETATFRYQYFLSTVPQLSLHQIPLPDRATGGAGEDTIGRKGTSARTDLVTIPSDVQPGEYYLGVILDPNNQFEEPDKRNNVFVYPEPLTVYPPGLRILTSALPRANLRTRYNHQLVSIGGQGPQRWTAEGLPPGMSLGADGLLRGEAIREGSFAFTVHLQAGGAATKRMLALQVIGAQSELEVATQELPIAVKGSSYGRWYNPITLAYEGGVRLSASGGMAPYRWGLDPAQADNRLPEGLEGPTPDGLIVGSPTPLSEGRRFLVHVTDALGNEARRWLELEVVEAGTLVLLTNLFPQATSGRGFGGCVEAQGGAGSYQWQVDPASLPAGLAAVPRGSQLCLEGMPTVCGYYTVGVMVGDGQGQSTTASMSLTVDCGTIQLNARSLRPVHRGEEVVFELGAIPSDEPVFRIVRGQLPRGLALSQDGVIAGTVAGDASFEPHDMIVELSDALGRRSLSALTLRVVVEPAPLVVRTAEKPGCSSAGSSTADFAALGVVWLLLRRRRIVDGAGPRRQLPLAGLGAVPTRSAADAWRPAAGRLPLAGLGAVPTRGAADAWRPAAGRLPLKGLLAALTLGATACGGDVTTSASRCGESACAEGFECDEADGLCKCGGQVICGAGEACSLLPTPQCVSDLCDLMSCSGGMSCHPMTGRCQCGEAVCGEDERCVGEVCVQQDPCAEVSCGEGLVCDPHDLGCKCGGVLCEAGAVCVDGSCEVDPCAGVSCGANSVCDPEAGRCRCGEDGICNTGEACLEEGGHLFCAISTLCDSVDCGGGSVCDPDDGRCRCGGVGSRHPVCEAGKSCVDGACRGGDLCAPGGVPTVCGLGLSCDPTDGHCKCGGIFGEVCADGEGCTVLAGEPRCTSFCTLLASPPTCGPGRSCYFDLAQIHGEAFCAAAGIGELDDPCALPNDCAPGLHCSQAGRCTLVCGEESEPEVCDVAGPNLQCTPFRFGASFGYCRVP